MWHVRVSVADGCKEKIRDTLFFAFLLRGKGCLHLFLLLSVSLGNPWLIGHAVFYASLPWV